MISIILATYNCGAIFDNPIHSLSVQTFKDIELVVVDDNSTDETEKVVKEYQESCAFPIQYIKMHQNQGAYVARNQGIFHAKGQYITFIDADDLWVEDKLEKQFDALKEGYKATTNLYVRVDENMNVVGEPTPRPHAMSMLFHKDLIKDIGWFQSVRYGGDVEYLCRIEAHYGQNSVYCLNLKPGRTIDDVGVFALHRVSGDSNKNKDWAINIDKYLSVHRLSDNRKAYQNAFLAWHQKAVDLKVNYPLRLNEPYYEGIPQVKEWFKAKPQSIYVGLATMPSRINLLEDVIKKILPQVDGLGIYLNGFKAIPNFVQDNKICCWLDADMTDNGKFYYLKHLYARNQIGYYLTIDDDLDYPEDYVQRMIFKIEQYGRGAAVGLHGTTYPKFERAYDPERNVYHFRRELDRDRQVALIGTGTTGFHMSLFHNRFSLDDFQDPCMADINFATLCKRYEIPLVSIQRSEGWLNPFKVEDSIWSRHKDHDERQTTKIEKHKLYELCKFECITREVKVKPEAPKKRGTSSQFRNILFSGASLKYRA